MMDQSENDPYRTLLEPYLIAEYGPERVQPPELLKPLYEAVERYNRMRETQNPDGP